MRPESDDWLRKPVWRFVVNSLVVWTMMGLYLIINHHQLAAPRTVLMPAWVPFSPPWIIPYLGLLLLTWLLPTVIRDPGRFRACLRANVCAWLLVVPWWVWVPTVMARPPLPHGFWAAPIGWLWNCDQPCNVFPCAHGIGPMVVAWFAGCDHPRWRWPLAGIVMLALPSIALVWQHRPMDIFLGTVAAGIGVAIGEGLSRREQRKLKSDTIAV